MRAAQRLRLTRTLLTLSFCAWVAICALEGRATPFGDEDFSDLDSDPFASSAVLPPQALSMSVLGGKADIPDPRSNVR